MKLPKTLEKIVVGASLIGCLSGCGGDSSPTDPGNNNNNNPPQTYITGVYIDGSNVIITGDATDPDGDRISGYKFDLGDGISYVGYQFHPFQIEYNNMSGTNTFYLKAYDEHGKVDPTPAIRTFNMDNGGSSDNIPPQTYIGYGPSGVIENQDFSFAWEGSDNETSIDDLVFSYYLQGHDSNYGNWTESTYKLYSDVSEGNYTFYVKAKDLAGNVDPSPATRNFSIDTNQSTISDKIVFEYHPGGLPDVYFMDIDGSNRTRLTFDNNTYDGQPSWSPDGSKIAFVSNRNGNKEIYTMNSDGSNKIRLTYNEVEDGSPSWSPDGSKISFVRSSHEICTMNSNGSNQINLLSYSGGGVFNPSWSSDGSKIVFSGLRNNDIELYVVDSYGGDYIRLTDDYGGKFDPSWSPDGSKIVFSNLPSAYHYYDIHTIDSDGSNQTRLTYDLNGMNPSWSSDGSIIAFEAYPFSGDSYIYTMNSDGSNQVRLSGNGRDRNPCLHK